MSKSVRLPGAVSVEAESPAVAAAIPASDRPSEASPPPAGEPAGIVVPEKDPSPIILAQQCEVMAGLLRRLGWRCEPPVKVGGAARPKLGPDGWEVPQ